MSKDSDKSPSSQSTSSTPVTSSASNVGGVKAGGNQSSGNSSVGSQKMTGKGMVINRTNHPLPVTYKGSELVLSPHQRVPVSLSKLSEPLPKGAVAVQTKRGGE